MSKENIQASLNKARAAVQELQVLATNAKDSRKLVASGRYAELKNQADSKKQEILRLEEDLEKFNLVEKEKAKLAKVEETLTKESEPVEEVSSEAPVVNTKSWWKFWG